MQSALRDAECRGPAILAMQNDLFIASTPERAEGITGETCGGDEEDQAEDEDAGDDHPSAFEAVDAGVQNLNQGDEHHQVAESAAGAETEQDKEHECERTVARGEISRVDVNGCVDLVMRRDQHGGVNQGQDCACCGEEGAEENDSRDPPGNGRRVEPNGLR